MKIGIVGAGLVGRTLAWQLYQQDDSLNISLFDKDPIAHGTAAAYTAAGMLAPYSELQSAESRVFDLGMKSLALWPQLADSLKEDIYYQNTGSIVIAHQEDRPNYLQFVQQLKSKLRAEFSEHIEELDREKLGKISPELVEHFSNGLYLKQEASVDSILYMQAVANRLQEAGVNWFTNTEVESISESDGTLKKPSVRTQERQIEFDWVIDCRGMGATKTLDKLRGVRGEVLSLHAPEVNIEHQIRLVHPRYCLYLAPRKNHHFVLGATQIESNDTSPVSVRSALELLSAVYSLHPGFAEARITHLDANCRPAFPDNYPVIETSRNVMRINGLFRHGYLLTPIITQEATNHILKNTTINI